MKERDTEGKPEPERQPQPPEDDEKRLEDLEPSDEQAADVKAGARAAPLKHGGRF